MGDVNADLGNLIQVIVYITSTIDDIEAAKYSITNSYQMVSNGWKDKKCFELGIIIGDCHDALNCIQTILEQTKKYIVKLAKALQEYENENLGSSLGQVGNNATETATTTSFSGLLSTRQQSTHISLNGRECVVFDHPFAENIGRICNQGSAYPNGPRSTCGCCSSATIINKAGGHTNEREIVAYALNNGFCDHDGYTTANTITNMLTSLGIASTNTSGMSLNDLAGQVEQGRGVIIAVNARRFDPEFYRQAGGHAVVLESIIRDAQTNEIVEYVVVDSNRTSSVSAARRVNASQLEQAFNELGRTSISTNIIIW